MEHFFIEEKDKVNKIKEENQKNAFAKNNKNTKSLMLLLRNSRSE